MTALQIKAQILSALYKEYDGIIYIKDYDDIALKANDGIAKHKL